MTFNVSSYTETATTTSEQRSLSGFRAYGVVLRTLSTNTDEVYVNVGGSPANVQNIRLPAGASYVVDLSEYFSLRAAQGDLKENDFIPQYSFRSASGSQTLLVDIFPWQA